MEILQSFGVQPILLAAQIVNFFILLFILRRFLYKPVLKLLDERKTKIAKSLKDAEEIEKRLEEVTRERDAKLKSAVVEAQEIIGDATRDASEIIKSAHEKAATDIQRLSERAQKSLEMEREALHREIKSELSDLIVLGLQKVAGKTLTEAEKKEMLGGVVKDLK